MAINSFHPSYSSVIGTVKRTIDALVGDVHSYVPKLSGQTNEQYQAYVTRSSYYNVVERTAVALIGALTRKPPTIEMVVGDDPEFSTCRDIDDFIQMCYLDLMKSGRVGMLVDYDDVKMTPYITSYDSTAIINWGKDFYVLAESYFAPNPKDKYEQLVLTRYRELFIDDSGYYAVRIWEQKKTATGAYNQSTAKPQYEVVATIEPVIRGLRMNYIPFVVCGAQGRDVCSKPVLNTLADINLDHFKVSVDISHGAHMIAIPTPYIVGSVSTPDGGTQTAIRVGGDQFIQLETGSSVGFLEFSGNGMSFLTDLLKTKEEQMYSLGSRMLQYKRGVESSDSLQIRLGAEGASLVMLAQCLEECLEETLYFYNLWMGQDVEPEVELNKDVSPSVIDPQQITALLLLFQKGVISLDTLLQRLYEGEIVDDVQEERELITGTEESDEAIESAVEGPNSEEPTLEEELAIGTVDSTVRAKAQ